MGIHRLSNLPSSTPHPPLMHPVVAQSLSCVQLFATLWAAACQASLSFPCPVRETVSIILVRPGNSMHKLGFCL